MKKGLVLGGLAAVLLSGLLASPAEARHRRWRDRDVRVGVRIGIGDVDFGIGYRGDRYRDRYYRGGRYYDPYYDPYYAPRPRYRRYYYDPYCDPYYRW